jgi:uncharacterized protein YjbI with pentapeptide repeats
MRVVSVLLDVEHGADLYGANLTGANLDRAWWPSGAAAPDGWLFDGARLERAQ